MAVGSQKWAGMVLLLQRASTLSVLGIAAVSIPLGLSYGLHYEKCMLSPNLIIGFSLIRHNVGFCADLRNSIPMEFFGLNVVWNSA